MESIYNLYLDDELADLIKSTLPEGVSIAMAGKTLLIGWALRNLDNKAIFECIGRMQVRNTLKRSVKYLADTKLNLRIKEIENFLQTQEDL